MFVNVGIKATIARSEVSSHLNEFFRLVITMKARWALLACGLCLVARIGVAADSKNRESTETISSEASMSKMFAQIKTGYAWSRHITIHDATVANDWDDSVEGYNASLTNTAFTEFAVGGYPCSFMDLSLSYAYYGTIHYQKYQTGISNTTGFTGDRRIRFFDFDHQNLLVNMMLHLPKDTYALTGNSLSIFPYIAAGIGAGFNQVNNFHTVAYNNGVGSTTSVGNITNGVSFAWQVGGGITFSTFKDRIAIDLGYNYYSSGRFKTSNSVMVNTDAFQGQLDASVPWKGTYSANEIILAFRVNF